MCMNCSLAYWAVLYKWKLFCDIYRSFKFEYPEINCKFRVESEGFEKSYGEMQLEFELEVQEYYSVSTTNSCHLVIEFYL